LGITYRVGSVAMEYGVVNLRICTAIQKNSSALEVACSGNWSEKFEMVILAENARMELKRRANESRGADLHIRSVRRTGKEDTIGKCVKM
jgi:hypothetical protein